jgi:starch synthase
MITRLDYSKGIDVLIKAIRFFDFSKLQLIILGSGDPYYQGILSSIAAGYPNCIVVEFQYSVALAKKIYAAADIYLMPSLFEPCGLGQLYAMRYGAVPVVNPVGGLKDTIQENKTDPAKSNGFYMEEWSGEALYKALERAVKAYHSPLWQYYVINGMEYDSTWKRSVVMYKKYYEELLNIKMEG